MREIKFRVWNEDENRMIYSDFVDLVYPFKPNEFRIYYNEAVKKPEVMLFTGLKDRNGKEIYAGDVLKQNGFVGKVIYEAPSFMVIGENGQDVLNIPEAFEVIGNIYETENK